MGKKIKLGKSRLARQPNLTRKSTDPTAVVVVDTTIDVATVVVTATTAANVAVTVTLLLA